MYTFLLLLTSAADLRIDHVTVAGQDLTQMREKLASVGIQSVYGGPHSNGMTEMAVASFPDGSYLELIAIQKNADATAHYWGKQMKTNAGPTAWAVRSPDVAAEAARLQAAGVTVSEPTKSGRTRPDGFRLDWETARVGSEPNGTFFPFLIRDFTPREQRVGKPTAEKFAGIRNVVIVVKDLSSSIARFRQAYNLKAPMEGVDAGLGARTASFLGTPVILAVPLKNDSWLAERSEGPCAFVLTSDRGPTGGITWFDAAKLGWHLGFAHR